MTRKNDMGKYLGNLRNQCPLSYCLWGWLLFFLFSLINCWFIQLLFIHFLERSQFYWEKLLSYKVLHPGNSYILYQFFNNSNFISSNIWRQISFPQIYLLHSQSHKVKISLFNLVWISFIILLTFFSFNLVFLAMIF